jgi:CheY-specific phosphatase CheX
MDNPKELDETMKKEIPEIADYFGMELTYNLSMPGKIIDSNTPVIHGDTLTWKVDAYRFFFTDYTLHTKSRKPNIWAFGLTGLLILLITGSFWIKKK